MTLVLDIPVNGPATHALVIGVGGYAHLEEGGGTPISNSAEFGSLGQLTSPPRSALEFAEFLTASQTENWRRPLSTVDLLISPAPNDKAAVSEGGPYDQPTLENIKSAFTCWWKHCDEFADNIALFYFCGHGLQGTNSHQLLLAADFGVDPEDPLAHAFDFEKTKAAFGRCRSQTQIFLIDACRNVTTGVVEVGPDAVRGLRQPKARQKNHYRYGLTAWSTAATSTAHGDVEDVSHFTRAMLHALREGGAAEKLKNGQWWVTTGKIARYLHDLMDLIEASEEQNAECLNSKSTSLYRFDGTPPALLELGCNPGLATLDADLGYEPHPNPGGEHQARPEHALEPWRVPVAAGIYHVMASFAGGPYRNAEDWVPVEPPITEKELMVVA